MENKELRIKDMLRDNGDLVMIKEIKISLKAYKKEKNLIKGEETCREGECGKCEGLPRRNKEKEPRKNKERRRRWWEIETSSESGHYNKEIKEVSQFSFHRVVEHEKGSL